MFPSTQVRSSEALASRSSSPGSFLLSCERFLLKISLGLSLICLLCHARLALVSLSLNGTESDDHKTIMDMGIQM
jgi:hypothetical protein